MGKTWEAILGGVIFVLAVLGVCTIVKEIKESLHMWFTKKKEDRVVEEVKKPTEEYIETPEAPVPVDEWIWVTGYKATERDMKCRDYQYSMGELYIMPEDAEIVDCKSGFHLCKRLCDVFRYYDIGDGNRYFQVKALVRKADYEEYGHYTREFKEWEKSHADSHWHFPYPFERTRYKLAARSIIFERELTPDEILENRIDIHEWADEYKRLALEVGIENACNHMRTDELTTLGYSYPFAQLIIASKKYDIAKSVASQPDLSMDMKCWMIFK